MINRTQHEDNLLSVNDSMTGNNPTEFTDPLWTVEDLADYLKLQPETIRSMARRGELPAIKLGKVWRFRKSAIYEMLGQKD